MNDLVLSGSDLDLGCNGSDPHSACSATAMPNGKVGFAEVPELPTGTVTISATVRRAGKQIVLPKIEVPSKPTYQMDLNVAHRVPRRRWSSVLQACAELRALSARSGGSDLSASPRAIALETLTTHEPQKTLSTTPRSSRHPTVVGEQVRGLRRAVSEQLGQTGELTVVCWQRIGAAAPHQHDLVADPAGQHPCRLEVSGIHRVNDAGIARGP